MTIEEMKRLWPLAKVLHEARRDLAWGRRVTREPWPEFSTAYTHNPIAYVDLALAQAEAFELWWKQGESLANEGALADELDAIGGETQTG